MILSSIIRINTNTLQNIKDKAMINNDLKILSTEANELLQALATHPEKKIPLTESTKPVINELADFRLVTPCNEKPFDSEQIYEITQAGKFVAKTDHFDMHCK